MVDLLECVDSIDLAFRNGRDVHRDLVASYPPMMMCHRVVAQIDVAIGSSEVCKSGHCDAGTGVIGDVAQARQSQRGDIYIGE